MPNVKNQLVNVSGLAGHGVSLATAQLFHGSANGSVWLRSNKTSWIWKCEFHIIFVCIEILFCFFFISTI